MSVEPASNNEIGGKYESPNTRSEFTASTIELGCSVLQMERLNQAGMAVKKLFAKEARID